MNVDHYAVVIGINDYTPPDKFGLKTLKGAINDAEAFFDWLTDADKGAIPVENVEKITSTISPLSPDYTPLDDAIFKILEKAVASGQDLKRFYFFFAGHGLGIDKIQDDNALCFATWSSQRLKKALSSREYKNMLLSLQQFDEVIFITDCCRNVAYNLTGMTPSFSADSLGGAGGKSTRYFYAHGTSNDSKTYEIIDENGVDHGLFTTVIMDALNGAAANEHGVVDQDSLKNYLVINTVAKADQNKYSQRPDIITDFDILAPLNVIAFDLDSQKTECNISITQGRQNVIHLFNEKADLINVWNPGSDAFFSIQLRKGMYTLSDQATHEKKSFTTSPGKKEIDVEF